MPEESNQEDKIDHIQQEVNILHMQYVKSLLWKGAIKQSLIEKRMICREIFDQVEKNVRDTFAALRKSGPYPGIMQDAVAEFRQEYQEILKEYGGE
jgi:hypothetical protein